MIPGRNQNVHFRGRDFHVQTEDSGDPSRLVTTHIYVGGTIIASSRTSYAPLRELDGWAPLVQRLMDEQHDLMVRHLKSGLYTGGDAVHRAFAVPLGGTASPPDPDEVIAEWVTDGLLALT